MSPYSLQLPECRAYEQVTPEFKDAANVGLTPGFAFSGIADIATSGQSVVVGSAAIWGTPGGDPAGLTFGVLYEITRGDLGWGEASLSPETAQFPYTRPEFQSPSDPGVGIWATDTPSQSENVVDLSLREADGEFNEIGPLAPASATTGPPLGLWPFHGQQEINYQVEGSSRDLSDVLFTIHSAANESGRSFLWPEDHTMRPGHPSLYEYVGTGHTGEGDDVPALVGVDNTGRQLSQCGTALGATVNGDAGDVRDAVSATGSTVFFGAQAGGCAAGATGPAANQLYARIGTPGGAQTTVDVAGTSGCDASVSCNVTSPVIFQGASKDGSKVFFTTTQALLPSDKDRTNNIYECELPGDGGATPAHAGLLVNACPFLKAVSVTGTSAGANVQSVVAVSEEGSHVYFTATGVLTSTANSQGRSAEDGKDNLYVWEAPGAHDPTGHTSFIATFPEPSLKEAQATPDGRYLVFTSAADLTLDDTSTVAQAFRYDAETGELSRISTGQNGFNDDGNTDIDPVTLAIPAEAAGMQERGVTISADGSRVVFESADQLTPQVQNALHNVYEWHNGSVYLISDGADRNTQSGLLLGMDESGANIFFTAEGQLMRQDTDESVDVYDARIDGGFPAPTPAASCSGEACQGPLSNSFAPVAPGSTGTPSIGNLTPGSTTFPEPTEPGKVAAAGSAIVSGGKASLKLTCSSVGACSGTIKLTIKVKHGHKTKTIVIGHAKYTIASGKSKTIKVKLDKAGMTLLRHHKKLNAKLTGKAITNRTIKLRQHTSKHHKKK
ncbi:MAG: TolB family protein [Solirubrobacteraceae bacterium]